jgi:hypothetical protein
MICKNTLDWQPRQALSSRFSRQTGGGHLKIVNLDEKNSKSSCSPGDLE